MTAELGQFALVVGFILSVLQAGLVAAGVFPRLKGFARYAEGVSLMAALSLLLAFGLLIWAFVTSDFSVANVAAHSHTDKPLIYRITGAWGSHEGSMMLWCTVLVGFGALVTLTGQGLPAGLRHKALGVQGFLGALFVGFTLFASNPLMRLNPAPFQGNSLNPALQDPGLAFHPPLLYLGYVGFSVAFSFAVAALIEGRLDRAWARYVRPWILLAWVFLTAGIALGAFWAYYELGWGGWWAWDPVENASFLPWLVGTAALHSAIVMERRDTLKAWTVLLALMAFTFAMLGAFLVRSGLLTSVHAFATDPARGIILMAILAVTAGTGLTLFALRAPELTPGGLFAPVSRESALVANNILITAALASVFLGTLWPLVVQAAFNETISIGAPYFLMVFAPVMGAALLILPVSVLLSWKRADLKAVLMRLVLTFGLSLLAAAIGLLFYKGPDLFSHVTFFAGVALGVWVVFGSVRWLAERTAFSTKDTAAALRRFRGLPLSAHGLFWAHVGVGVFLIGAVVETHMRLNHIEPLSIGDSMQAGAYEFTLDKIEPVSGPNFDAQRAEIRVTRDGNHVCTARPERRFYPASSDWTSEVALCFEPLSDVYVVLGEGQGTDAWTVRAFHNPWIRLVFVGPLLMILGGILSLSDRRLRLAPPTRAVRLRKKPS